MVYSCQQPTGLQLSVIIVSYNVKHFLEQCLYAVRAATKQIRAEVWVVDNASKDGTVDTLQPLFPEVQFIANGDNLGFGKANNLALSHCSGKYVLFLNPDTLVPEDSFIECLQFLEQQPNPGALGVRMIDGGGRFLPESKRSFPSPMVSFFKLTGLCRLFPQSRVFGRYALAYLPEQEVHAVDVIAGAFMMCRRSSLVQVNGFDASFFMYGEDIDLSYRLQQLGLINWYLGKVSIVHFKGESSKKGSVRYLRIFYEAMIVFVKKHYRGGAAAMFVWLFQMAIWIRAGLSAIYYLLKRLVPDRRKKDTVDKMIVVAAIEEQESVIAFLRKCGREAPALTVTPDLHIADMMSHFRRTLSPATLVLCIGTLSWREAIALLPRVAGTYKVRFHAYESHSIVGSDSKDAVGEVISV